MFPGMNPKMMKQAMKRMGIQHQEIEAIEVIIKTPQKELVIENPQVLKMDMMGQETFQIIGQTKERDFDQKPEINEEDIKTVMEQTGADKDKAKKAIEEFQGDLARAILSFKNNQN